MGGYIEKKRIRGKTYYYLTETIRAKGKWKKIRKYLGVHTPAGFEKPHRQHPKPVLTKEQMRAVDRIRKNYGKVHRIAPTLWQEERKRLVSFVYNTNAIEGNTLTLEETDSVLRGKRVDAKPRDIQEVRNMKKCIDFLFQQQGSMDETFVLALHRIQMGNVLPDAGVYRTVDVRVGSYLCPRHEDIPRLMRIFMEWYREAKKYTHVFELAALVHLKFVRIHPFRDGNGRMARLLMNFILLRNGYPLLNIFNSEKLLYYLVLRKVDSTKRSRAFVKYVYGVYVQQYREFLE